MAFEQIQFGEQLVAGDRLLLRFQIPGGAPLWLMRPVVDVLNGFHGISAPELFGTTEYVLESASYTEVRSELNVIVNVRQTTVLGASVGKGIVAIVGSITGVFVLGVAVIFKATDSIGAAIVRTGEGVKETLESSGKGIGVGLALVGAGVALWMVGGLKGLKGV